MHVVKRTKSAPLPDGTPGPARVHYATASAPEGNVTGWAAERAAARSFGDDEAERVLAFYEGRPNAGRLDLEPAAGLVLETTEERAVVGVRGLPYGDRKKGRDRRAEVPAAGKDQQGE